MSGYIAFSTEFRPKVKNDNPSATFGEIAKLIGAQWRAMPEAKKAVYSQKAAANAKAKAATKAPKKGK